METERTLLITGATGMIGGSLVRDILERKVPWRLLSPIIAALRLPAGSFRIKKHPPAL